jgi:hypothetical protein
LVVLLLEISLPVFSLDLHTEQNVPCEGGCHLQTRLGFAQVNICISRRQAAMAKVNPIQIQKHLKGMDYPATKEELLEHAKQNGADRDAQSVLEQLPEDEYETPAEVSKAIGQLE